MNTFAVLFAMPVSKAAFMAAAQDEPVSDYMRITLESSTPQEVWDRRYGAIANAAQSLLKGLREWDVFAVERATLDDLRRATVNADVVVVFGHWCEANPAGGRDMEGLELSDGVYTPESLEVAIASDFAGTLDLCNCTSERLASHIKWRRGDAVSTIFNTELLDPLPAYVIVRHLIEYCMRTGVDYRLARLQAAGDLGRGV